jgi:hypothetical protein
MELQRELLDQLLGPDRDIPLSQLSKSKKRFTNREVCKYYLAGLCPYHELFKNTKSDQGPCQFQCHDERYKEDYKTLSEKEKSKLGYERELHLKLQDLVREMDRKIARNKQRADEENAPKTLTEEQIHSLEDMAANISRLVASSQELGEKGEVEKSLKAAHDAYEVKLKREISEQRFKYPVGRIMFVCDVCGVFINSTDNEARRADHYNGKQYVGWRTIRNKLKELDSKICY